MAEERIVLKPAKGPDSFSEETLRKIFNPENLQKCSVCDGSGEWVLSIYTTALDKVDCHGCEGRGRVTA